MELEHWYSAKLQAPRNHSTDTAPNYKHHGTTAQLQPQITGTTKPEHSYSPKLQAPQNQNTARAPNYRHHKTRTQMQLQITGRMAPEHRCPTNRLSIPIVTTLVIFRFAPSTSSSMIESLPGDEALLKYVF
jgi:hypothetical protein